MTKRIKRKHPVQPYMAEVPPFRLHAPRGRPKIPAKGPKKNNTLTKIKGTGAY